MCGQVSEYLCRRPVSEGLMSVTTRTRSVTNVSVSVELDIDRSPALAVIICTFIVSLYIIFC